MSCKASEDDKDELPVQFQGFNVGIVHELRPNVVVGKEVVDAEEFHKGGVT